MENTYTGNEVLNRLVAQTVGSRMEPIELLYEPIYDCDGSGEAIAYRVNARVNSMIAGSLMPADYLKASVPETLLSDFFCRILGKAAEAEALIKKKGLPLRLMTVRCPSTLVYDEDLCTTLGTSLALYPESKKLCLEFYEDVTDAGTEALTKAFAAIHATGLWVAIDGYGGEGFPIERLFSVSPDFLFTDARVSHFVENREKAASIAPLINLAKSLGTDIIADSVDNDTVLREFRSREAFGFIPSDNYSGNACERKGLLRLPDLIPE